MISASKAVELQQAMSDLWREYKKFRDNKNIIDDEADSVWKLIIEAKNLMEDYSKNRKGEK